MKYLVLLVVLVVVIGIWRSRRDSDKPDTKAAPAPLALPQDMLACAHCGIHIPQAEALMLGNQASGSAEHQRLGPA